MTDRIGLGLQYLGYALNDGHPAAASLGTGLLLVRPTHAVSAELSSAVVVLGGAMVGAPMSMTQAIAAALVGSGARDGHGRVRWRQAVRTAGAWVVTLPTALALAAATAIVATAA